MHSGISNPSRAVVVSEKDESKSEFSDVLFTACSDEQLERAAGELLYAGTGTGKACTCPDC
ncbi:MAG: hypothetical protein IPG83_18140 [Novosphingobium sp.]|nr:hypothetical protein [Novosphingobium sp.]